VNQAEQLRDQQVQQQHRDRLGVYVQEKAEQIARKKLKSLTKPETEIRTRTRNRTTMILEHVIAMSWPSRQFHVYFKDIEDQLTKYWSKRGISVKKSLKVILMRGSVQGNV
jgi:hypothetical protein